MRPRSSGRQEVEVTAADSLATMIEECSTVPFRSDQDTQNQNINHFIFMYHQVGVQKAGEAANGNRKRDIKFQHGPRTLAFHVIDPNNLSDGSKYPEV